MAGTAYTNFFWADWAGDPLLILCSPPAQALWMRLLCLAAEADPIGHVLINGKKPTPDELETITRFPAASIVQWSQELIERGVCDLARGGVMVSRRMVRDCKRRQISRNGGQIRQLQKRQEAEKEQQTPGGSSPPAQPPLPESNIQHPESINANDVNGESDVFDKVNRKASLLCNVIGVRLEDSTYRNFWPTAIERMIDEGISFEAIFEAAKRLTASGMLPPNGVTSPTFFRREAISIMRRGKPAPPVALVPASKPQLSFDDWKKAFEAFVIVGAWVRSEWGPSPLEPGCVAPLEMIAEARRVWENQGNHPKSVLVGNAYKAWEPEYAKHSLIKAPTPFASRPAAPQLAS